MLEPGTKWMYREERYTLLKRYRDAGDVWYDLESDCITGKIESVNETSFSNLFEPFLQVGDRFLMTGTEYHANIDKIYTDHGEVFCLVRYDESKLINEILRYQDMIFLIDTEDLIQLYTEESTAIQYGDTCSKCHTYNEWVEKTVGYVCWGCRNGF